MIKKTSDDQKRDEVLKRMLATPHKPHQKKAETKPKSKHAAKLQNQKTAGR